MEARCDFCSAPDPKWEYPAKDFKQIVPEFVVFGKLGVQFRGSWLSCNYCHDLIELREMDTLARFGVTAFIVQHDLPKDREVFDEIYKRVIVSHEKFLAEREGEAVRISED